MQSPFRVEDGIDRMNTENRHDRIVFVKIAYGGYSIIFEKKNMDIIEEKLGKHD